MIVDFVPTIKTSAAGWPYVHIQNTFLASDGLFLERSIYRDGFSGCLNALELIVS
jgi:hypothetical protein